MGSGMEVGETASVMGPQTPAWDRFHHALTQLSDAATVAGDALYYAAVKLPHRGLSTVTTAPIIGDALRFAQLVGAFGSLAMGFAAVRAKCKGLPKADADALIVAFCEENRDVPLKACLSMGGFYIKAGQMLSGIPVLPQPWAESLRALQKDVPPRPLEQIVEIIQHDFGCTLEEAGLSNLSKVPLGAASIGQVHSASLNGHEVVVKVMYPEVERYFRLDFQQIVAMLGGVNEESKEAVLRQQEVFEMELDYRREGANLRKMCDDIQPHVEHGEPPVRFPQPFDSRHPALPFLSLPPGSKIAAAGSLVTKSVLVMERCEGATVTDVADELLGSLAAAHGVSADEHRMTMRAKAMTATKTIHSVGGAGSSLLALRCAQCAARPLRQARLASIEAAYAAENGARHAFNALASCVHAPARVPPVPRPIELRLGPGLVDRLFAVHARMLFTEGIFNADPHPGNVLVDKDSGALTLLDYGQLVDITLEERTAFAYFLIAGDTSDLELAQAAYTGLGFDILWKGAFVLSDGARSAVRVDATANRVAYAPPPAWVCLNEVFSSFGSPSEALAVLAMYGFDPFSTDGSDAKALEVIKDMVTVRRLPGVWGMLLRMSQCLKSVATAVGMGDVSAISQLAPHARDYLFSRGLGLRDLVAASAGKEWRAQVVHEPRGRPRSGKPWTFLNAQDQS